MEPDLASVVTARIIYLCVSSHYEMSQKTPGMDCRQFHAGVKWLKGREEGGTFGHKRRVSRIPPSTEQNEASAMLSLKNIRGSRDVR